MLWFGYVDVICEFDVCGIMFEVVMLCDVFDVVVVICCVKLFDLLVFGNVGSFFKNLVIDVV